MSKIDRNLTSQEKALIVWMLENGNEKGKNYLSSIEKIRVVEKCDCGCASIDLSIGDIVPDPGCGLEIVSDYLWVSDAGNNNGVFVFSKENRLAGLEVYSADGLETPGLPEINSLISFDATPNKELNSHRQKAGG